MTGKFLAFFKLPPPGQRWAPSRQSFWFRAYLPGRSSADRDDIYILWMSNMYGWCISLLFGGLYLTSYFSGQTIPFIFFDISIDQENLVDSFSRNFTMHVSLFLYAAIYPWLLTIYFANIPIRTFDVLWYVKPNIRLSKFKVLLLAIIGLLLLPIIIWHLHGVIGYFLDYLEFENSIEFLVFSILLLSFFNGLLLFAALQTTAIVWLYGCQMKNQGGNNE